MGNDVSTSAAADVGADMQRAFCRICNEWFGNGDEYCSGPCGHIYHAKCLRTHVGRKGNCPNCLSNCKELKKIYFTHHNPTSVGLQFMEMQSQLNQNIKNVSRLENQLEQHEREFSKLNIKYTTVDDELEKANEKIRNQIIEMENKDKEIEALREMRQVKANKKGKPQVKAVEEKLNQVTLENEQENSNLTESTVNKMKLPTILRPSTSTSSSNETKQKNLKPKAKESAKTPFKKDQIKKPINKDQNKQLESESIIEAPQQNTHGVIIKNLTAKDIDASFTVTVLKVTEAMGLNYTADDIERVFLLDEKLSLVVVFKTHHLKMRFLANRSNLKNNPFTKNLYLIEFNALSHYAQVLKTIGYQEVYIQNRQVFARIDSTFAPVAINSTQQVDEMVRASKKLAAVAPK